MEDELIATLYQRINYDKSGDIYILKPIKLLEHCKMDYETDILTLEDGVELMPYDSKKFYYSGEDIAYGYPQSVNKLIELYDLETREDALCTYADTMDKDIVFCICDIVTDNIKTVLADVEQLRLMSNDSWFYNFYFDKDFDSGKTMVVLSEDSLKHLKDALDKDDKAILKTFIDVFEKQLKVINDVHENQMAEYGEIFEDEYDIDEELSDIITSESDNTQTLDELNSLIGMEDIKKKVKSLSSTLKFLNKVEKHTNIKKPSLNMFMTGNSGTGKTTVARIIAKVLANLGYAKKNKYAEITATDLVGQYVGQTGEKTRTILKKYKGGVIFIDEAYSLASEGQEYGEEALAEIVNAMGKEELIVIFAGYEDEMKNLIELNSGLRSRIGYFINFNDYTKEELFSMFMKKVNDSKLTINDDAKIEVMSLIENCIGEKNFGNGRFIDKLFDKMIIEHSVNIEDCDEIEKLITITKDDVINIEKEDLLYKDPDKKKEIGFQYSKK